MLKKTMVALAAFSCVSLANADYYSSVDEDSCWDGRTSGGGDCVVVDDASWSQYTDGQFKVRYKNICDHRVYVRYCNGRENGSEDCGATGIGAGRTSSWSTYNASGEYSYNWIGVERGSMDWVCSGKVSGWHD